MASAASAPPAPSVVVDDHSLSRVPRSARYGWFQVAVQRFGQISALSQFLLGATLGFGMGFWEAFWAITLGAVILEIVSVFVGIIAIGLLGVLIDSGVRWLQRAALPWRTADASKA